MKLHYYSDTDSLYIEFKPTPSAETREVAGGLNVDLDADSAVVGLDIDHASKLLDLSTLDVESLPLDASGSSLMAFPAGTHRERTAGPVSGSRRRARRSTSIKSGWKRVRNPRSGRLSRTKQTDRQSDGPGTEAAPVQRRN